MYRKITMVVHYLKRCVYAGGTDGKVFNEYFFPWESHEKFYDSYSMDYFLAGNFHYKT